MFANPVLASPGGFAFGKLRVGDEHKKEHVFVAGYSDGQVYMHSPSSDLASSWRYDTQSIYQSDDELGGITFSGHTIRMVAMGEFNSDDRTDLVIPNNERNQVLILEQNDWRVNKDNARTSPIIQKFWRKHSFATVVHSLWHSTCRTL